MAAVGLMEILPLGVALGGAALLAARKGAEPPPEYEPSDERRRREEHWAEMQHGGASASHFQYLVNKQFLMGTTMKETVFLDLEGAGPNPNPDFDPFEEMFGQHLDVSEFDRHDTLLSLTTGQGEVRPKKRTPIVATLTPELVHPNDPTRSTSLGAFRGLPNWANEAQVRAHQKQKDPLLEPHQQLQVYHDGEFFNRAPGQSFRYG